MTSTLPGGLPGPPKADLGFADLHVHADLPWIGAAWRRRVQGFRLEVLDEAEAKVRLSSPFPRLFGLAFYRTYLLRPTSARRSLFRSLADLRKRIDASGFGRVALTAQDLTPSVGDPIGLETYFLAVESMRPIGDPADVERLWDLGVRSLQPIHFLDTAWGGSSREGFLPESRDGISGLGREMLSEMGRLGLILDLAHMSRRTAEDALALYRGPVMCSHTGLWEVKASARNLPAELAREVFRRRGLVGITCWRHLLGPLTDPEGKGPRDAWTRAFCATVTAFASLADDAGVAVGSDRGAPILAPAWMFTPDHLAEIGAGLANSGWTTERINAFLSGNVIAFLSRSLPKLAYLGGVARV